jgi:hypothetical protein
MVKLSRNKSSGMEIILWLKTLKNGSITTKEVIIMKLGKNNTVTRSGHWESHKGIRKHLTTLRLLKKLIQSPLRKRKEKTSYLRRCPSDLPTKLIKA